MFCFRSQIIYAGEKDGPLVRPLLCADDISKEKLLPRIGDLHDYLPLITGRKKAYVGVIRNLEVSQRFGASEFVCDLRVVVIDTVGGLVVLFCVFPVAIFGGVIAFLNIVLKGDRGTLPSGAFFGLLEQIATVLVGPTGGKLR